MVTNFRSHSTKKTFVDFKFSAIAVGSYPLIASHTNGIAPIYANKLEGQNVNIMNTYLLYTKMI